MTTHDLHPLAEDYLRRLRRAGRRLPPETVDEMVADIEGHLAEALSPGASDHEALEVLERLGPPGDIVEAERPAVSGPVDRRGLREWAAVILLPLGGFALGVGWLVGLWALWTSRLWTTREKLIGTLIVPGGIATALLFLVATGTRRRCIGFTPGGRAGGPFFGGAADRCTPGAGPGAVTSALEVLVVAFLVLAPIVTAVYLARRARGRSGFTGPVFGAAGPVPEATR